MRTIAIIQGITVAIVFQEDRTTHMVMLSETAVLQGNNQSEGNPDENSQSWRASIGHLHGSMGASFKTPNPKALNPGANPDFFKASAL